MTTPGIPTGKLDNIAKVSLVLAPILIVVFNFLLPTNGTSPIDPEDSGAYIAKLGGDADIAQIYYVLIAIGMILFTRAIIGLYRIAPEGASKQRLQIGMFGSVGALSLWAVLIGIGFAEASVAEKVVTATAGAQAGVEGAAAQAGNATLIASALHAAYFGIYQITTYVAFIMLIPIGGGLAISGIVRREFGWLITLIGVVTVVVTSVMQIKTEEGIVSFGIIAVVFGVVFLLMGLQILRQDME
ncbi:MAG: hypothetical protein QF357_07000 [Dehalococcoidia bacterium]|jgi:hypothetical protein|nr:hypothetical protein [Dehalococcoidia bacterium]